LADMLAQHRKAKAAWDALTAGKQRALAIMVASAKREETVAARVDQVRLILLGEAPLPWVMGGRAGGRAKS
jgi:uncharacterized protein YdeI (YjbR/CyaY-like superfamily)